MPCTQGSDAVPCLCHDPPFCLSLALALACHPPLLRRTLTLTLTLRLSPPVALLAPAPPPRLCPCLPPPVPLTCLVPTPPTLHPVPLAHAHGPPPRPTRLCTRRPSP